MIQTVVFDTKPYDREALQRASAGLDIEWRFMDCRLSAETAAAAHGAQAVCTFVNDRVDRPCLEALARLGVRHVALRCAGFNSIDLIAANELGFSVTRVPAYSPYAVAEHAVALLLALNRKIPRANNRVHDLNFALKGLVGFDLHGKTAGIYRHGQDWPRCRTNPARVRDARVGVRSVPVGRVGAAAWRRIHRCPHRSRASVKSSRFTRRLRRKHTTSSVAKRSN